MGPGANPATQRQRQVRTPLRLRVSAAVVALIAAQLPASVPVAGQQPVPGWRAGDPAARAVSVSASNLAVTTAVASDLMRHAGIATASVTSSRTFDNVTQLTLDTSIGSDARGRPVATVIVDATTGKLRTLINFSYDSTIAGPNPPPNVVALARTFLGDFGLEAAANPPQVSWDEGMEAWQAIWVRSIGGYVAPTNFVSAWINPSGTLKAVSDIESPNLPVPLTQVSASTAQSIVRATLMSSAASTSRTLTIGTPTIEWRPANNFIDPTLPDAPALALQLVFTVPYSLDEGGAHGRRGGLVGNRGDRHR